MEVIDAAVVGDHDWDELCQRALGAWFWHTSSWRDYSLAYRPALASRSLAFLIADEGRPLALVPLMVEQHPDGLHFSFGGDACWSPALLTGSDRRLGARALRTALDHIDRLAAELGVIGGQFRVTPIGQRAVEILDLFLAATTRAGYSDVSLCTQVVNVAEDPSRLRAEMSKGHRHAAARGRRSMSVFVSHAGDAAANFASYRAMHAIAAGRITRPPRTFELMETWLTQGKAALFAAVVDGTEVGFMYVILHGSAAYYASAANHPDAADEPVGHVLQTAAIEWLHHHGVARYETGMQQFGPLPYNVPSAKEMGIAHFKRGFGGETVPLVIREKWYSTSAFERVWEQRMQLYRTAHQG